MNVDFRAICASILLAACLSLYGCAADVTAQEITREQAIEVARQHVSFEPENIQAIKDTEEGQPVWRVTFRRKPDPHPVGAYTEVLIDRRSGRVVGLAQG